MEIDRCFKLLIQYHSNCFPFCHSKKLLKKVNMLFLLAYIDSSSHFDNYSLGSTHYSRYDDFVDYNYTSGYYDYENNRYFDSVYDYFLKFPSSSDYNLIFHQSIPLSKIGTTNCVNVIGTDEYGKEITKKYPLTIPDDVTTTFINGFDWLQTDLISQTSSQMNSDSYHKALNEEVTIVPQEIWTLTDDICPHENTAYIPLTQKGKVTVKSQSDKVGCLFIPGLRHYSDSESFRFTNKGKEKIQIFTSSSIPGEREVLPAGDSRVGSGLCGLFIRFKGNAEFTVGYKRSIFTYSYSYSDSYQFTPTYETSCSVSKIYYCTYNKDGATDADKLKCSYVNPDFSVDFSCSYNWTLNEYLTQIIVGILIGLLLVASIIIAIILKRRMMKQSDSKHQHDIELNDNPSVN